MRGAWIRMFCHFESTQNSQKFEHCFHAAVLFNKPSVLFIDLLVNKYFFPVGLTEFVFRYRVCSHDVTAFMLEE